MDDLLRLHCCLLDTKFNKIKTVERQAFAKKMVLVSDAIYAIYKSDSGDYSEEDATEMIMKVISHSDVLDAAVEAAEEAKRDLERVIELAKDK